ncbi:Jmjd1a protein [Mycena albidolilacea]|uniref:Jmjd1a protein n=1 Tax=Mycena albidolilacea TaxID=1033008 RepID=A0AAD7ATR2_9AGAR|nr:Jmjd1a protein [Mycena albidolilacea]
MSPPTPMRATSVNDYPPNHNARLILQNVPASSESPTERSPYHEERTVVPRKRADSNVSSASMYSNNRIVRRSPGANGAYESPDTGETFPRRHLPDESPQPTSSNGHRESPEIDTSAVASRSSVWQVNERPSLRLAAREHSPRESSPTSPYEYYHQQFSEQLKKRNLVQIEDPEEPPKKRKSSAKPRELKNASGNKSAKKHGEQIAAHSDQLPTTMYTIEKKGKNRDDAPHRVVPVKFSNDTNLFREDQMSRCMSSRYKSDEYPKCVSCTRRWAGDTCRFQNLRSFFRDSNGNLVGVSFTEKQEDEKMPKMEYPDKWNVPLDQGHLHQTKKIIAAALLPTLREELEHINLELVIYRPRESEVRATCDTCLTSIFCCSWMCRCCGREACPECFQQIQTLTIAPNAQSPSVIKELQRRRDKFTHQNPFFLNCMKRNEHGAKDFSPMTRFSKPELTQAIRSMEQLLQDEGIPLPGRLMPAVSEPAPISAYASTSNGSSGRPHMPPQDIPSSPSNDSEVTLVPNGDSAHPNAESTPSMVSSVNPDDIPSHEILRFTDSELTDEIFRPLWAQGDPLLVTDVGTKLRIHWSPEYFIGKYGNENCVIIECQTEENKRITVGEFFRNFGHYEGREKCWKLKDWPPEKDFKTDFPELYDDFNQAVPIPHYVRRDGALNIASHFPTNTIGPDLGPKMYNANANRMAFGTKGSTRLHMDMADALNLMTYAAPDADGKDGCAAWDLFRAQDSDKIRQFMREKFVLTGLDPIHLQQIYLDDEARRLLWEEYNVKSYRVYQKAGEAVFIPAGCAHQVRNLSDCIKVAIDFVSPENIARCEKLTKEFREVNQTKAWKEDVLQLRTMMWFAWLSCCRQEGLRDQTESLAAA